MYPTGPARWRLSGLLGKPPPARRQCGLLSVLAHSCASRRYAEEWLGDRASHCFGSVLAGIIFGRLRSFFAGMYSWMVNRYFLPRWMSPVLRYAAGMVVMTLLPHLRVVALNLRRMLGWSGM